MWRIEPGQKALPSAVLCFRWSCFANTLLNAHMMGRPVQYAISVTGIIQLVVPAVFQHDTVAVHHNVPTSGHLGVTKTV